MSLNRTQKLMIAKRVEQHFDTPESWFQGGWGRKFDGLSVRLNDDHGCTTPKLKHCKCLCLSGAVRIAGAELLECRPAHFRGEVSESILRHYVVEGHMDHDADNPDEPYRDAVVRWNDADDRALGEVQDLVRRVVEALEGRS